MTELEASLGMSATSAQERVLRRARRYVEHETPSGAAAAIEALAQAVAVELEASGADVTRMRVPQQGMNLHAHIAGRESDAAPVLILAHIDTVHPIGTLAARPLRIEDGRAYGPGIYDMKSGLAVVVEALTYLHERGATPRRPVELLITCDEEIGSHSARALIIEGARRAAAVLVPEPCMPDGGAKTFRKGVATYRIDARGRAAHAGIEGHNAVSAITELVHALSAAIALADHARGTTINVGTISGGTASNVVAAEATAVIDVRIAEPPEGERVHAALMALTPRNAEGSLRIERSESRPPLVRTESVAALYLRARELARGLGVELPEGGTGGGSDGSIAAAAGAATLDGLGPLGAGAHAIDEHIVVADLAFRLALLTRLLQEL